MAITSALVLLAVCWFMTLFLVLPVVTRTQADAGTQVPGTHVSAPENFKVKRTAWIVTLIAVPIWLALVVIITMGWITLSDFDLFTRFGPPSPGGETGG